MRILLAEDNLQVADVAIALLKEQGHAVTHASTADEALARLHADALLAAIREVTAAGPRPASNVIPLTRTGP